MKKTSKFGLIIFSALVIFIIGAASTARMPLLNAFLQNALNGNNQSITNINNVAANGAITFPAGQSGPSNAVNQTDLNNLTLPYLNFLNSTNPSITGVTTFLPSTVTLTIGVGSPASVVTAPVGSLYLNTSGGSGTTLYVKESGTGNTGWVGK